MEHVDTKIVELNEYTRIDKLCKKFMSRIQIKHCTSDIEEIKRLALEYAVKSNFSKEELNHLKTHLTNYVINHVVEEIKPIAVYDFKSLMDINDDEYYDEHF